MANMSGAFVTSLMPPFNLTLLHQKLDDDLAKLQAMSMPTTTTTTTTTLPVELYQIKATFAKKDQYWCDDLWFERFRNSKKEGILFRPAVINELVRMVETCLAEDLPRGLMIKGPQGIGKSHSIVNLVYQLLYHSNGKYFVTFIPDCALWTFAYDLFESICASFGSTSDELGITWTEDMVSKKEFLEEFVEVIDAKLAEQGRQWVFVFDQIDSLSDRYHKIRDISALPFPFNYMRQIMKSGRITSILSASANNALLHRDHNHSDFLEYHHCLSFSKEEVLCTYPLVRSFDDTIIESIMAKMGGVPLQVHALLSHQKQGASVLNFEQYERYAEYSVQIAVRALKDKIKKAECLKEVTRSACCCLLSIPLDKEPRNYDRRYSVWENGHLVPLFPLVSDTYRSYFWKDLLQYIVEENEHGSVGNL